MTVAGRLLPLFTSTAIDEEVIWTRSNGIEFLVPASDQVVTPFLLNKRSWDTALGETLLDAMDHGTCFLDVGAMIGYFSALVAKHHPLSQVYGVEPNPASLEIATVNLSRYPNAHLLQGGVASTPNHKMSLVKDTVNIGNTHLIHEGEGLEWVATATLHDLVNEYGADVVKVDVQGMEEDVLASLDVANLSQNDFTIFSEITPESWGGAERIRDAVGTFAASGFSGYFIHENATLTAYSEDRLDEAISAGTSWWDHFEFMLTRGRYDEALKGGDRVVRS